MNTSITIRRYQPADRDALFRIAADTAFFGEPVEVFLEDRRIFLDAFYSYYPEYEPEHCWIACDELAVVGFITGCVDTCRQREITSKILEPMTLRRLIRGKYRVGRKTWAYLFRYILHKVWDGEPEVDLKLYPAHFHVNVDYRWRGAGIGKKLILKCLDDLRSNRSPGVHLQTTNYNQIACHLYESLGFKLIASKPTHLWEQYIDQRIENRCYGMLLLR